MDVVVEINRLAPRRPGDHHDPCLHEVAGLRRQIALFWRGRSEILNFFIGWGLSSLIPLLATNGLRS